MSNEIVEALTEFVDDDLHGQTLDGYAARKAALELLSNWDCALTDGSGDKLVNDVDLAIARLRTFRDKAVELLPLKNGGLAGLPLSYWKARLKSKGVEVVQAEGANTWRLRLQGGDGPSVYPSEAAAIVHAQNAFLPDVSRLSLSPLQMARVRIHEFADTLHGWIILADTRACSDVVYLVSEHRDLTLPFPFGEPYAEFMRARNIALVYAEANPEVAPAVRAAELVITSLAMPA
jgi:hypothetical protein